MDKEIERLEIDIKRVELDNKLYATKIQNEKLRKKYERTRDAPCPCCYLDYCTTCSSLRAFFADCAMCLYCCKY